MTISVPPDLRERMDQASNHHTINWSAVAVQAFERQLGDLLQLKKEVDMTDVLKRLQAQDSLDENPLFQQGREAGEEWAKVCAMPYQLRRLGEFVSESGVGHTSSEIVEAIEALESCDYYDHKNFWEGVFGDNWERLANDRDAVAGFADGAYEVYRSVRGAMRW